MTIELEPAPIDELPADHATDWPNRTIGQTPAWLAFVAESQGARPVVARVLDAGRSVGWFTGATVRRGPIRQLGSPLPGWTTAAMGLLVPPDVDRVAAIAAVPDLARSLGCPHVELADRELETDVEVPGFRRSWLPGYQLAIGGRADEDLLAAMTTSGRRDVRRALRNGIEVDAVDPQEPDAFLAEHRHQLEAAFAKRGLRPTYGASRTASLVRHLGPTGHLLLLRATTPEGQVAATGIFVGLPGGTVELWAAASERALQPLLPNEALMWAALRWWRDAGAATFDFGGGGSYKRKYGGAEHRLARLRWSRWSSLEAGRRAALAVRRSVRRPHPPTPRN
ncbi:MAG TPA: GNAT family N-acetyltransferase [Aquihabitans sp.]|nr:GNAT family N-acetyltransferase [Aquihabitans sp.]